MAALCMAFRLAGGPPSCHILGRSPYLPHLAVEEDRDAEARSLTRLHRHVPRKMSLERSCRYLPASGVLQLIHLRGAARLCFLIRDDSAPSRRAASSNRADGETAWSASRRRTSRARRGSRARLW